MIQLLSEDGDEFWYLGAGEHVIGRNKEASIVFDEPSVSRRHAVLRISRNNDNNNEFVATVDDVSRFGTFLNGERIDKSVQPLVLSSEAPSTLRFGSAQGSSLQFRQHNLGIVFSGLSSRKKRQLYEMASCKSRSSEHSSRSDDGLLYFFDEWDDEKCTHLIVDGIVVSLKLMLALLRQRHVVTADWLRAIVARVQQPDNVHLRLPDESAFVPKASATDVLVELCAGRVEQLERIDVRPNAARATLFAGLSFVCVCADQVDKLRGMIEAGGGRCLPPLTALSSRDDFVAAVFVSEPEDRTLDEATLRWLADLARPPLAATDRQIYGAILWASLEAPHWQPRPLSRTVYRSRLRPPAAASFKVDEQKAKKQKKKEKESNGKENVKEARKSEIRKRMSSSSSSSSCVANFKRFRPVNSPSSSPMSSSGERDAKRRRRFTPSPITPCQLAPGKGVDDDDSHSLDFQ
jgi:FHA domain